MLKYWFFKSTFVLVNIKRNLNLAHPEALFETQTGCQQALHRVYKMHIGFYHKTTVVFHGVVNLPVV